MSANGTGESKGARITFIGYGEVGQTFARGFLSQPGVTVAAYDILLADPGRSRAMRARAAEDGVALKDSAEAACAGAEFVISAVTAAEAPGVARDAAAHLKPGQIFLDVNSVSPTTKREAAGHVEKSGANYVEAAVMAAVLAPGLKVPILTAGAEAEKASARLNGLGMNMTPVASEVGRASATKLCRSIMIKGIEALMVDCTLAARHWGVSEDVFASLDRTFPGTDWTKASDSMLERVARHGLRRSAEMEEAARMLEAMGMASRLCREVSRQHQRFAGVGLDNEAEEAPSSATPKAASS